MSRWLVVLVASAGLFMAGSSGLAQTETSRARTEWVAEAMKKMATIKPGMTRADLLKVFTTEGGISTRGWHRYVTQECPYFKVNVTFRAVGEGNDERGDDVILTISQPFMEFSILD